MNTRAGILLIVLMIIAACTGRESGNNAKQKSDAMATNFTNRYGNDRDFLKKFVNIIELKKGESALILVPDWQGRVMTSTAEGDNGFSFGCINHDLVTSRKIRPHINAFGGEERVWLGPEGGQFSIFFRKGSKFIYDDWQTPAFLDTTPYEVISKCDTSVLFACDAEATNYSGTHLKFRIEREVRILSADEIAGQLGIDVKRLKFVGYSSSDKLINKGKKAWIKETGLLSVWMLGMFTPSPSVVIVVPFNPGDVKLLGPPVNDNYFGRISADRLKVKGDNIYFRADGKKRGKIGLPPLRSKGIMVSYDSANNILTLLICKMPSNKAEYVNSAWQLQENPFSGDAMNSYNDGPLEDGSQMGPFYELETSSPAAALKPGESLTHEQYTLHITGDPDLLGRIAADLLGVTLDEIKSAF
jgi:hypothetical protein